MKLTQFDQPRFRPWNYWNNPGPQHWSWQEENEASLGLNSKWQITYK